MNYSIGKKLYIDSCFEELEIFKPGNQNIFTNFSSSKILKFREAAKISSDILCDKNLNLGESIFFSSKKCFDQLGSNFNLGIILLCAPILKIFIRGEFLNLRGALSLMLKNISNKEGYLILKAIKYSKPAGLKNYIGKGSVNSQEKYLDFNEIMKIGSRWDRISKCYTDSFSEIFDFGLPLYRKLKLHQCSNIAGINVFLSYLSNSTDSHLLRKFGSNKARMIQRKAVKIKKLIGNKRKMKYQILENFDRYLKNNNYNPGTCADLTVTTLLIDKIIDIVSNPI